MKEVKKGVMDILLYGIVFVVVQLIVSFLGMLVWCFVQHEELADVRTAMLSGHNPVLLALTSVFSSVITLVVFLKTKWTPISRNYLLSKPWLTLLWVALFALGAMIPLEFVYEQIGLEMDETTGCIFEGLLKEPWGYVAVGILAPLTEEVVFRGAILRTLLGMMSKRNHWVASQQSAIKEDAYLWNHRSSFLVLHRSQFYSSHEVLLSVGSQLTNRQLASCEDDRFGEVFQHKGKG